MNLLDGSPAESPTPTPYGVLCVQGETRAECCNGGNLIFLTEACYAAQLSQPDYGWSCPRCGGSAMWSDDNYQRAIDDGSLKEVDEIDI